MDYFTKWVEAYPAADQTTETIVRLLVANVVCCHGVPDELLSDRGQNLLSELMKQICSALGMSKVNTTAHHPQTDGLVENMNKTLRAMIAKHVHTFGIEWDQHLQQLLFAYRVKPQESTQESPFFLLYGRDARIPTETTLSTPISSYQVDMDDYRTKPVTGLTEAWKIAKSNIGKAQRRQKIHYDKKAREVKYQIGDRVMVYMPHEDTGKLRKLALPYHGPYRVLELKTNGVVIRPVDKPQEPTILVNIDRVTHCPVELPDVSWLGKRKRARRRKRRIEKDENSVRPLRQSSRLRNQGT